jgi:hypothetical protein
VAISVHRVVEEHAASATRTEHPSSVQAAGNVLVLTGGLGETVICQTSLTFDDKHPSTNGAARLSRCAATIFLILLR